MSRQPANQNGYKRSLTLPSINKGSSLKSESVKGKAAMSKKNKVSRTNDSKSPSGTRLPVSVSGDERSRRNESKSDFAKVRERSKILSPRRASLSKASVSLYSERLTGGNGFGDGQLVFRVDPRTPPCVKRVFLERGWKQFIPEDENDRSSNDKWHIYWRYFKFKDSDYVFQLPWQVMNHFPKTYMIGQKDCLARNLKRMRAVYGCHLYDFFPKTYILPIEYTELLESQSSVSSATLASEGWMSNYLKERLSRGSTISTSQETTRSRSTSTGSRASSKSTKSGRRKNSRSPKSSKSRGRSGSKVQKPRSRERSASRCIWIAKPSSQSQGRGIKILNDLRELRFNECTVVQRYIENPLLISGYKFDLRLYVVIVNFHPLTVYLYKEGLVRFATQPFSMNDLHNKYSHLTNTSINKSSPDYGNEKENIGPGCIWALSQLKMYLEDRSEGSGRHPAYTWHKITNIINLTILTLSCHMAPQPHTCFELLGFDVLIDADMKPWLLEVNVGPALTLDTPLDAYIKKGVVENTIYLCEYLFYGELDEEMDRRRSQEFSASSSRPRSRKSTSPSLSAKANEIYSANYSKSSATPGAKPSTNPQINQPSRFSNVNPGDFYKPRVGSFSSYEMETPKRLGEFRLIYPFNEESSEATVSDNHDIRSAIYEIRKRDAMIMRKLHSMKAKSKKNSRDNQRTPSANSNKIEQHLLWCP